VSSTKWIPVSFQLITFWVQKKPWSEPGIDMFVATVFSWTPNSLTEPTKPSAAPPGSMTPVDAGSVMFGGAVKVTWPMRRETLYE